MRRDARDLALEDLAEQLVATEDARDAALADGDVYRTIALRALDLVASYRTQVERLQRQLHLTRRQVAA